jgi:hypothetical protein
MNDLIKNIENNITPENKFLVDYLINTIEKNSLNTIEELINLENSYFTIEGNILSKEEKIKYCYDTIINSFYDADALEFDESLNYYKYYDLLKLSKTIEDKIKYIILLNDITGREQLLIYELYKYITNK